MTRPLFVVETPEEAAERAAVLIQEIAPRTVALSGGSTPRATYELLGRRGTLRNADIWLADERCVPPDSPDANARLVRESLGDAIGTLNRVRGEDPPDEAARIYDEELRARLGDQPVFDLIVLGMGGDGHTASLFPGAPEVDERTLAAVATAQAHNGFRRVTLTLPVLNRARATLFIVCGPDKAPAFARIQDGEMLPAGRVLGATWVLDRAAATPPSPPTPRRKPWEPIEGQEALFEL